MSSLIAFIVYLKDKHEIGKENLAASLGERLSVAVIFDLMILAAIFKRAGK